MEEFIIKKGLLDSLFFFTIALIYLIFDRNFGMILSGIFCGVSLLISNLGRKFLYLQTVLFIVFGLLLFIVYKDLWLSVILILIGLIIFIFYLRDKICR
ncbi:hypothetical protein DTK66_09910 [Lactobacillus sp. M31]|uniref:Uncharacterized protein n=1 Tax=Limosilactobacillus walteri TaxID=2268022 RepID=A0ABR8P9L6_9LACO|nr:hypothetical protein [Limosilactobacillus walteri]